MEFFAFLFLFLSPLVLLGFNYLQFHRLNAPAAVNSPHTLLFKYCLLQKSEAEFAKGMFPIFTKCKYCLVGANKKQWKKCHH